MRPRAFPLLVPLLLTLPAVAATSPAPAPEGVQGPDADGAYLLSYAVHRDAAGAARLLLHVQREDGAGVVAATRDLGQRDLPVGATQVEASFLPLEGAGDYAVSLSVDGVEGAPLRFRAQEGSGGTARFAFAVQDEPTLLALTTDAVNADGKAKSPGEALVTRATLSDGNGLAELDGVRWRVERGADLVEEGALPFDAAGTSAALESRWARSPAAAGMHRLTLVALKDGHPVANASRTFLLKDVAPVVAGGNLTPALAGRAALLSAELLVADRNGAPGPIEARVYKASTRVEGQGFLASLGEPAPRPDADGFGRTAFALQVRVPEAAAAGLYRVSLYANGTLAGSLPLDVRAPATLATVHAEAAPGGALRLVARGAGEGHLEAGTVDAAGHRVHAHAPFAAGAGDVTLPASSAAGPLRWDLRLLHAEGGETLETRNGTWPADAGPVLALAARHVTPRLPASWDVRAPGWDLAHAQATVDLTRWDGAPAAALSARLDGDVLRVTGPADVEPGRYDGTLHVAFPNGTTARVSWSFEAGPWMRLRLGEPIVEGREARIPLHNDGGLPARRLVAEVAPDVAHATLVVDGHAHEPRPGPRRAFSGFDLPPGATAELVLRLPPGPLPSGARDAQVRLLALTGGAS